MSFSFIPSLISLINGPELPIHVAHPYPTLWKPSSSMGVKRLEFFRYSVTTIDPGANDVFTQGFLFNPRALAFFATSPAAIVTPGLEVFVQEVIAAITISPLFIVKFSSLIVISDPLFFGSSAASSFSKEALASFKLILSWGLFGPAIDGKTVDTSNSILSEYIASLQSFLVRPTSSEYFLIKSIWDSSLFDNFI